MLQVLVKGIVMSPREAFKRICLSSLICFFLPLTVIAQADQSANFTPPLALYYGSDVDSVSLPTRNLRVSIPLIHLKGRGLDFDVAATFNTVTFSTAQTSVPNVNQFYETTAAGGGCGIGVNHMGVINHSTSRCTSFDPQGICQGW